jgi:hypothetical protein
VNRNKTPNSFLRFAGGYPNVIWVGDRKALPHQLNGKSSNINHMVLRKMYPEVTKSEQVLEST